MNKYDPLVRLDDSMLLDYVLQLVEWLIAANAFDYFLTLMRPVLL